MEFAGSGPSFLASRKGHPAPGSLSVCSLHQTAGGQVTDPFERQGIGKHLPVLPGKYQPRCLAPAFQFFRSDRLYRRGIGPRKISVGGLYINPIPLFLRIRRGYPSLPVRPFLRHVRAWPAGWPHSRSPVRNTSPPPRVRATKPGCQCMQG